MTEMTDTTATPRGERTREATDRKLMRATLQIAVDRGISGVTIHHIGNIHKYARSEDVPEHTLFVITTDGMENASRRYSAQQVKEMIQRQKEKYGWEFLFLGANIDAVETAGHLGIAPDRAVNYHCDSEGTRLNYEVVGQAVAAVRCSAPLDEHWKDAIEEDFRKRQKRR